MVTLEVTDISSVALEYDPWRWSQNDITGAVNDEEKGLEAIRRASVKL